MSDLDQFRAETREWLEEHCPKSMREPITKDSDAVWGGRNAQLSDDQQAWLDAMAQKGWTAPVWPKEYGGGGLSKEQHKILKEELARINARQPLLSFGLWMLGPALLKYASEEQKQKYLPDIIHGKIRWCQGYSEPGSGSDLASLQTKAIDQGDHYLVNGQKVWTSYADKADWIFCLVRTDNSGTKHQGISFLLIDMTSDGVSTKPIKLISGASPFCETFLDNVKVPKENVVGDIGKGWDIAKYLLTHEREMIGNMNSGNIIPASSEAMTIYGLTNGQLNDPMIRTDLARFDIDGLGFLATLRRSNEEKKAGQSIGAVSAILKYYGTELNKRHYELKMAVHGFDALNWDEELPRQWLRTKGNSIEGGTSEVQLNIIAKRVLNLPDKE